MRRLILIAGLLAAAACNIDGSGNTNDPGGSDGSADAATDAGSADVPAAPIPTFAAFCVQYGYAGCDRSFACDPTTSLVYCRYLTDVLCAGAVCLTTFNPQAAGTCVADARLLSCDIGISPASCDLVCPGG